MDDIATCCIPLGDSDELRVVGVAEGGIDGDDVVVGDARRAPCGAEHVGLGAGGDVVGADDEPAFDGAGFAVGEVVGDGDDGLVGDGAGVEDGSRGFFTFVLGGVEQETALLLEFGSIDFLETEV